MNSAATNWKFHSPVQLHVGRGSRGRLIDALAGKTCLVVTSVRGRRQLGADPLLGVLGQRADLIWVDGVTENPGLDWLESERARLRGIGFDAVVGFGGGSSLDSAKVLAVSLAEGLADLPLRDLLANPALHSDARPKPLYALPTTAGTGSEVTPFSTVWDHAQRKKYSLAGPAVYAAVAIVDADLTDSLPAQATLSTGLDAINQAAESIWNRNMTPVSEGFATRALQQGFAALPRLMANPADRSARTAMAECSVLAGLAISQTRTALCHSMSYPITAHFGVSHGLACAFTMPAVLEFNLGVDDGRFERLAHALLGPKGDTAALLEHFQALNRQLGVGKLVRTSIPSLDMLLGLASEMFTPGRADNNLADVDTRRLEELLDRSWHDA